MEYYSTTQNDVEKEEGELSSSDDDDDDQGNIISGSSHSAHAVEAHTEREVILSADQPIIDEMSQIVVIDEWKLDGIWDKENQSASSNKTNPFTSSNKVNKSADNNKRNNSTAINKGSQSSANNKVNQSSAKCKKNTPDPKYDVSRNAPQDKKYPSCQKSLKGLKRHFAVASDFEQPSQKYHKPANTVWNELSLDAVNKFSSSDKSITVDLRNQISRPSHKSGNFPSFGEAEKHAKRWNALCDGNKSVISKHKSAARQTSNYSKTLSRTRGKFSSVNKFNLSKYKELRYQRTPSERPASKNQSLHVQVECRGQRKVVRKVKQHFDQQMRKSNLSNQDSQLDGSFHEHQRDQFHDSPHLTSPHIYDSGYTTHNDYLSEDSSHSYTPSKRNPNGIPAVRSTQTLPFYSNNRSNVSPSYLHAEPYQPQPAPMLVTTPGLMLARAPQRKPQVGSLSDDIDQKLHSIRVDECNQFHSQNTFSGNIQDYESTSALNSSHVNPQVVSSTWYYSSKILAVGSDVSTSVFNRLGPHVGNRPADIQTGLDVEYPGASFSDSTNTFSSRNQFSSDSATGRNARNLITVAEASKPVSGGWPNRHVNDSIMQKNLNKNTTETKKKETKEELLERFNKLKAEIILLEMKASNNCRSPAIQKSRFKIDRTSNAKSQSVYKIDKRAVPDCSAQKDNSHNMTLEEKEEPTLLSSVLPQMNKEAAANVNLESNLPEAQTVPTESQEEPKVNEMERRHVAYSSPLRIFEYYRNKQASDKKITETNNENRMTSLAETQQYYDRHVTAMESIQIHNDTHVMSQTKKQETYDKHASAMKSTEENDESHVTSPVETQEDYQRYVSVMEITETNDERHVLIKAETQEDCDKHVTTIEITKGDDESHETSPVQTQKGGDKHVTAIEDTKADDESHVRIKAEVQEDCDKQATTMESTCANNESHAGSSVETQEDCDRHVLDIGSTELNDENSVMGPIEAQETCYKFVLAMESTETNYKSHVRSPVETAEDCDRHVSLMESTETNEENHEMIKADVQEDCDRHFSTTENTEANDENHVLIQAKKMEDCDKHDTGREGTKADDGSHVMSPVKTQEICDKHVSAMESTEGNDESNVMNPAETQENCDRHVTIMECTETHDDSLVTIKAEIQKDCDKHAWAMESTE